MHKSNRPVTFLLIGIFSFVLLLFYTHAFPPTYLFHAGAIPIPGSIPFFALFFLTLFGLGAGILKSNTQGIITGIFGLLFLLLRMLGFTHWFFSLVLVTLFGVIELFLIQKN